MMPNKILVVFVVAHSPKQRINVERCAAGNQFALGRSQSEQDSVIEVYIIGCEIGFIPPDSRKCVASDCIGVVGEGFDDGAVCKVYSSFLDLAAAGWEVAAKACDSSNVEFGLAPAGTDEGNVEISCF